MDGSPQLTKSNLPPLLSLTYVLQQSADGRLNAKAGVGLSQARILSALSTAPTSQRHIALTLHQTEANVSRQLKVMKKHGLVSITKNKKDKRQRDVCLTKKGSDRAEKALKILKNQQTQFLKTLNSSEAEILEFAAQKLTHGL